MLPRGLISPVLLFYVSSVALADQVNFRSMLSDLPNIVIALNANYTTIQEHTKVLDMPYVLNRGFILFHCHVRGHLFWQPLGSRPCVPCSHVESVLRIYDGLQSRRFFIVSALRTKDLIFPQVMLPNVSLYNKVDSLYSWVTRVPSPRLVTNKCLSHHDCESSKSDLDILDCSVME